MSCTSWPDTSEAANRNVSVSQQICFPSNARGSSLSEQTGLHPAWQSTIIAEAVCWSDNFLALPSGGLAQACNNCLKSRCERCGFLLNNRQVYVAAQHVWQRSVICACWGWARNYQPSSLPTLTVACTSLQEAAFKCSKNQAQRRYFWNEKTKRGDETGDDDWFFYLFICYHLIWCFRTMLSAVIT